MDGVLGVLEESGEDFADAPWKSPAQPRIQPLTFSFPESELLSSKDDSSEPELDIEPKAKKSMHMGIKGGRDSDSDDANTDITQSIRRLKKQLAEGGSSDSETESQSATEEGPAGLYWAPANDTGKLRADLSWAESEGALRPDGGALEISEDGDDDSEGGSKGGGTEGPKERDLWQGLGGGLAVREQRRQELMKFVDTVLHPSKEAAVQIPPNFQALVDNLAKQRKPETPLAWAESQMVGTPNGLQWARPDSADSGLVSLGSDFLDGLSEKSSLSARPPSEILDPKLQRGFERIEQLDRVLEKKQAVAEETARQVYPEKFAAQEEKARSLTAVRLANRRRRRHARLRRAMLANGRGSKRVWAGDYLGRNMVLGPSARYFTLLPEEEALVSELLAQSDGEMGDEDASYTTAASTGFDVDGYEAMQLATINAKLSSLRGHTGFFDSDTFSFGDGSSIVDFNGVGSMSRALPQEMGPGSRVNDSAFVGASERVKANPEHTPRGADTERPNTQRSGSDSAASKASTMPGGKPLSSQKRRASSSSAKSDASPQKVRRENEGQGKSQGGGSGKARGVTSESSYDEIRLEPGNGTSRQSAGGEGERKAGPGEDYLREQRERREGAAKQEEIDRKLRELRTSEIAIVLSADDLAELLEQCRQEQQALKQRDEMMRRISTPAFSDVPTSDGAEPPSGLSGNPGSSKASRRSSIRVPSEGGQLSGSEMGARSAGRKSSSGAASSQVGVALGKMDPATDSLTRASTMSETQKATRSKVQLPSAKGAGPIFDTHRTEKRPKSADALLTLPAL